MSSLSKPYACLNTPPSGQVLADDEIFWKGQSFPSAASRVVMVLYGYF